MNITRLLSSEPWSNQLRQVYSVEGSRRCYAINKSRNRKSSISVQATAGHIRMHVEGKVLDLPAGHLLALERAIAHDLEALEDSAFLLTIAWPDEIEKV
jgi:quercetin dioxygenase-like cupin family protein